MSSLSVLGTVDSRLNLDQPVTLLADHVAQNVRYLRTPISAYSLSSTMSVSVPIPSLDTIVDRTVYLENACEFTFAGTGSGNLVIPGDGRDALRFAPFHSVCNNTNVSFNGLSFSSQSNEEVDPLWRTVDLGDKKLMSFPAMQDTYQQYSDNTSLGDGRNVLSPIGSNDAEASRGGFNYTVVSTSSTATVVRVKWWEPLLCPPFVLPNMNNGLKGFANCTSISFQFSMNGTPSGMWSHSSNGNTLSSVSVAYYQAPAIIMRLYQMNPLAGRIPDVINYETRRVQQYTSSEQTLTTGSSVQNLSIPSVNLQSVPELILIYFRQRLSDRTLNTTDTYGSISSLALDYNNRANLLSDCTEMDLYNISVKNGLKLDFPSWQKHAGSVVVLSPSDFGLEPNSVANALGSVQIAVRATCTNNRAATVTGNLYVQVIYSSLLTVKQGQWNESNGYLNQNEVMSSRIVGRGSDSGSGIKGGGFFSDAWSGLKDVGKTVYDLRKPIAAIAKPFAPAVAQPVLDIVGGRKPRKGKGIVNTDDQVEELEAYIRRR